MLFSCKVVFVDTDPLPAPDSRVGDLVQNEVEANLVFQVELYTLIDTLYRLFFQLVEALLKCGVMQSSIGVLTLYRQQTKLLSHFLQSCKGVEVLTADRSQGRDKDCIIISMVRSNDTGSVGLHTSQMWACIHIHFTGWRPSQGLATSQRLLHSGSLKTHYLRIQKDASRYTNAHRILPPDE